MDFNKRLNKLVPYTVSQRVNLLKDEDWLLLDWNESTQNISERLKNVIFEFVNQGKLNLYGDVECRELRIALSEYLKVKTDQLAIFNGSDSALNILIESIVNSGDLLYMSNAEYSQIKTFVDVKGGIINEVHYTDVFNPDFNVISNQLLNAKVFYFSNPNNPTGTFWDIEIVERLISTHGNVWFIIDEAYIEFVCKEGMLSLVDKYNNLFILRTFSKAFGLAGLRIGYVISQKSNLDVINKIRNGKEVSSIGQFVATDAINNHFEMDKYVNDVSVSRNFFINELKCFSRITVFNSAANFVLVKSIDHEQLFDFLYKNKILVRDRSQIIGLENCLRITIGSLNEMERVIKVLKLFYKI